MFCEQINKLHFPFTKKTVEITQVAMTLTILIHVPEGHAVVNSKIIGKIWGINNVRRITVLLIHR